MKKSVIMRKISILVIAIACICGMSAVAFADDETPADSSVSLQPENGIPLVIVRVDETKTNTIDAMNGDRDHNIRCEVGTVEVKLPEGYKAPDGLSATVPEGEMTMKYVRGRGNSTWTDSNKKPYKVELLNAQDLFGMGASTDWALLANSLDKSLMRNRITFWLGQQMGLAFTPQQVPVDLVMIGENGTETKVYDYGTYCLCETIKIEDSRINIGKLKKKDTGNITGGYLLATYSDQDGGEPESTWFTTKHGVEIYNDSPDYEYTDSKPLTDAQLAQRDYIRGYVQEVEDLIMDAEMEDGKITAEAHNKIAEKMDMQSAADFWLLQEVPNNTDGYATTSTYLYKARDGKLYWGPLWDFDYAWWNNNSDWGKTPASSTLNNTRMLWIDHLREYDPQFAKLLKERWNVLNGLLQEVTKEGGLIDQYAAEVSQSQQADYEIWKDQTGPYQGTSAEAFSQEITKMNSWIDNRRTWVDNNRSEMNHSYFTAVYMARGKVVATESVRYDDSPVMNPDAPAPNGYVLKGWYNGKTEATKYTMRADTVFQAEFLEESEAKAPEKIAFEIPYIYDVDGQVTVDLSKGFFPAIDREGLTLDMCAFVEPYGDVTNPRITWTSSNENVGTIDPVTHRVVLKAGGETTITGTLYNGVSGSFVLHVTGPAPEPDPDAVSIQDAKVVLSAASFTYNGKVQKPAIKTINGMQLIQDTDYTSAWKNASSKNAGTYSVTITGKGKYQGTTSATYKIAKAANPLNVKGKKAKVKFKKLKKKKQTLAVTKVIKFSKKINDKKTYTLSSAKKGSKSFKKYFKISKTTGKVTIKKKLKKGTYKVKVKVAAAGNANYKASAKTITFKVKVR